MVKLLLQKMLRDMKKSMAAYGICLLIVSVGFCGYCLMSVAAGLPPKPQTVYIDIISRKRGKVNIIQYGGKTNGADNERVPERIF